MTDTLWLFRVIIWAGISWKWTKLACHFKKTTVCVSKDKIQAFKQKSEFWKTCIHHHELDNFPIIKNFTRTSLVAQWLRIRLPIQGTRVWSLVREDPTWRRATKPVCPNYWACALELTSHNYWARVPQLLKPARLDPVLRNKRSHRNEKPVHLNGRVAPARHN